jgi:hypothetical protein
MSFQELSLWTRGGAASKRTRVSNVPWGVLPSGMLQDGSIFFASASSMRPRHNSPQRIRTVDSAAAVLLKRPEFTPLNTVALPQVTAVRDRDFATQLPFAPRLYGTTCDSLLFASWSADSTVRVFDATAHEVSPFHVSLRAAPIPEGVWQAAINSVGNNPDPDGWKERGRRLKQFVEPATHYARHAGVIAETCDRIWMREYENSHVVTAGDTASFAKWTAFSRSGEAIDEMLLPATANILRIYDRRLLIRLRDENDVPRLEAFRRR